MKLNIEIEFGENERIIAFMRGKEITINDSPFTVFLATAGMCSAVYVRAFSEQRNISHDDIVINQIMEYDQATNQVSNISIGLQLPTDFPTKYSAAIKKVINQCPVKRHLLNPPTFDVVSNLD